MPETFGQQLKNEREKQNLSLKQVVDVIHIREVYLNALEEDRLEEMLSPVQAKGFLRLYADFLDLSLFLSTSSPTSDDGTEKSAMKSKEEASIEEVLQEENDAINPQPIRTFGSQFSEAREQKALELTSVESELHISKNYLLAIENENITELPPGIQARGLIQRYADFLELNTEEILGEFADLLIDKQSNSIPDNTKRKQARKVDGAKQFFTPDLIIGLTLVGIILVIGFFSIRKVISTRNFIITNEPTSEAVQISSTATLNIETTPVAETQQGTSIPADIPTSTLQVRSTNEAEGSINSRVVVQIIANQRAFLRITADGEIVFDGRVKGGVIYEFYGEDQVDLLTGNAAALDITVIQDGRETRLGTLGLVGQVINLTFQPDIIITPTVTPSLTPTVTNTPLPSATPTTTPSPTPTEEQ